MDISRGNVYSWPYYCFDREYLFTYLIYATDEKSGLAIDTDALVHGISFIKTTRCEGPKAVDTYALFEKFSQSGLCRLGLRPSKDVNFHEIWKEAEPYAVCYGNLLGPLHL